MIRYRLAKYASIGWRYQNVTESRASNFLLEGLITWRDYEIQVAAYNNRGAGVFSKSEYITTQEGGTVRAEVSSVVRAADQISFNLDIREYFATRSMSTWSEN